MSVLYPSASSRFSFLENYTVYSCSLIYQSCEFQSPEKIILNAPKNKIQNKKLSKKTHKVTSRKRGLVTLVTHGALISGRTDMILTFLDRADIGLLNTKTFLKSVTKILTPQKWPLGRSL